MPRFLITYHGGVEMPSSPEGRDQMMSAFLTWAGSVGDDMVDPGSPLGQSKVVTSTGETNGRVSEPVTGFTIISTENLESAVGLVRAHPFLSRGGTLQVSEEVAP
jgi:hypothetical protein